uniref:MDV091.5-like protein n=1 Tax=anatid alphaherpesvirus 1 TaxID=104388 RepID=E7D246_9ALPH|nr:MDV091.5-like protein [Anatid alphaherpesvirus 1]
MLINLPAQRLRFAGLITTGIPSESSIILAHCLNKMSHKCTEASLVLPGNRPFSSIRVAIDNITTPIARLLLMLLHKPHSLPFRHFVVKGRVRKIFLWSTIVGNGTVVV